MIWSYGVTTVSSRRNTLLPKTLASLKAAGFDRPHLFVDGDGDGRSWEREFGLDCTARGGANVFTAGHWVLSMYELYWRIEGAERFILFQDDLVTYRNLRGYLEAAPYPGRGYCNLYTFPSNQGVCPMVPGTHTRQVGWYRSNQMGRGAVALMFSAEALEVLFSSQHLASRPRDRPSLEAVHRNDKIDGGVVDSMKKAGWVEYVHNPTLVQHTGDVSSMGNGLHPKAIYFEGQAFDALSLLGRDGMPDYPDPPLTRRDARGPSTTLERDRGAGRPDKRRLGNVGGF